MMNGDYIDLFSRYNTIDDSIIPEKQLSVSFIFNFQNNPGCLVNPLIAPCVFLLS
jgi:hypothetical protein